MEQRELAMVKREAGILSELGPEIETSVRRPLRERVTVVHFWTRKGWETRTESPERDV